jgi:hypothetical protein
MMYLPARLPWTRTNGDGETPSQQPENLFNAVDLRAAAPSTVLQLPGATNATIEKLMSHTQSLLAQGDVASQLPLTVTLVSGPSGMVVTNGVLTWTPTSAQGPSTNLVTVAVSDGVASVTQSFLLTVRGANRPQTLTWTSPATNTPLAWGRAYPLVATASSGLPVSFRVQEGPAFISGGQVTATNAGVVVLVAEQAGNATNASAGLTRVFNQAAFAGAEKVGEWPGFPRGGDANGVQVVGSLAYVADGDSGLQVVDVSNSNAPRRLGSLRDGFGDANGVQVVGSLAYVADGFGLRVIDVSDPTTPRSLGSIRTRYAIGLQVTGARAYVADLYDGLQVIDVSDPAAPRLLGGSSGSAMEVQVAGTIAYVADWHTGLKVIDVSDATTPRLLADFDSEGHGNGGAGGGHPGILGGRSGGASGDRCQRSRFAPPLGRYPHRRRGPCRAGGGRSSVCGNFRLGSSSDRCDQSGCTEAPRQL